jgi:hypothetical protein
MSGQTTVTAATCPSMPIPKSLLLLWVAPEKALGGDVGLGVMPLQKVCKPNCKRTKQHGMLRGTTAYIVGSRLNRGGAGRS